MMAMLPDVYPGLYWEDDTPSIFCDGVWEDIERIRGELTNNQEKLAHFNRKIEWFRQEDLRLQIEFENCEDVNEMSMEDVKRHGWLHPLQHMRGRAAELNVFRQQFDPQRKGMGNMSVKNIVLSFIMIAVFLLLVLLIAMRSR